ncbi:hypothetical protein HMI54_012188 [Coelomomyces lativittatus]|nr:hypothetical protein HMI54_012188 [Coelomomyces lativittatus]
MVFFPSSLCKFYFFLTFLFFFFFLLAHPITSFATAFSSILAVQFGPNYLVSASADNIVRVYDVSPPKLLHTFTGHVGKVTGIAVGSQTRWCVSGAGDRTLKLWDLEHGYCRQTFFAFSHCLDVTACDSGLTQVASAHEDGKVRVWDTLSGQLVHDIGVAQKVGCLSVVAKDIHQLITLSRDNLVRVIDLRSMQLLPLGSNHMRVGSTKLGLSPKGTYVSVGAMDGSIFVWDLRTNEHLVLTGGHGSQVNHVQWDPVSGSNMYSIDKTGHLTVWGATT